MNWRHCGSGVCASPKANASGSNRSCGRERNWLPDLPASEARSVLSVRESAWSLISGKVLVCRHLGLLPLMVPRRRSVGPHVPVSRAILCKPTRKARKIRACVVLHFSLTMEAMKYGYEPCLLPFLRKLEHSNSLKFNFSPSNNSWRATSRTIPPVACGAFEKAAKEQAGDLF